jgi:intracellular multiplication protein IcmP
MQNRASQGAWEGEQAQLLLAFGMAFLLCWLFFDMFVYWTSWTLYWLWKMVDFAPVHVWVGGKINLLVEVTNHAKEVTLSEWFDVMNETSSVLWLFLIPLVAMTAMGLVGHPALPFRSKRVVNIRTLPRLVSAFAPAVIPVLAASGPDGLMNDTSTGNAWALKPEEFADRYNLVQRKVLDQEAARAVFEAQIGGAHNGFLDWTPYERALLGVFGLQVFLNDRKAATRLLDDLNRSCLVKGFLRRKHYAMTPIYGLADKAFERVAHAPGVSEWLHSHGSVRTALAGLYGRDLRLAPARFRWLKGVDRTLWYALHSADTAKVFVEGAGVLAQTRAETHAHSLGLPRPGLMVTQAIDGLQVELESIGWVFSREVLVCQPRKTTDVPVMAAIYAPQSLPVDEPASH